MRPLSLEWLIEIRDPEVTALQDDTVDHDALDDFVTPAGHLTRVRAVGSVQEGAQNGWITVRGRSPGRWTRPPYAGLMRPQGRKKNWLLACEVDGELFLAHRRDKQTCSTRCRQALKRMRDRGQI